jgi:hypothetical protein
MICSSYPMLLHLRTRMWALYLTTCTPRRCVKILSRHLVTLAAGCIPSRPPAGMSPPLIAIRLASATRNWLITILIDFYLDLPLQNADSLSSLRWSKLRFLTSLLSVTGNYIHPPLGPKTCDFIVN